MTDERAYRVHLRFEQDKGVFTARAPELDLTAQGETRAEAIEKLEDEIESRIQGAAAGDALPPPIDVRELDGTVQLKLSQALARELAFQAQQDGLSVEAFASELIARSLGALEASGRGQRRRGPRPAGAMAPGADDGGEGQIAEEGNRSDRPDRGGERSGDRGGDRGGGRGGDRRGPPGPGGGGRDRRREGYRPELDDKANFLEYLRGLEKGGGGGPGRGRGGR